jgi:hypothetical protein
MTPTKPTFGLERFPAGTREVIKGEGQPEYVPLPTYHQPDGTVVTCWMPDEDELRALLSGEPLIVEVLTFNGPLQPLRVYVPQREQ